MTDDQLDDLKQLIVTTIHQTEARLSDRMDGIDGRLDGIDGRIDGIDGRLDSIDAKLEALTEEVHDGFAAIADVFEQHDARITILEQKAA